jgi:hypothetical protein
MAGLLLKYLQRYWHPYVMDQRWIANTVHPTLLYTVGWLPALLHCSSCV